MKYAIVTGSTRAELVRSVQGRLNKGWRPQGGIAITGLPPLPAFLQAMVKEEED